MPLMSKTVRIVSKFELIKNKSSSNTVLAVICQSARSTVCVGRGAIPVLLVLDYHNIALFEHNICTTVENIGDTLLI